MSLKEPKLKTDPDFPLQILLKNFFSKNQRALISARIDLKEPDKKTLSDYIAPDKVHCSLIKIQELFGFPREEVQRGVEGVNPFRMIISSVQMGMHTMNFIRTLLRGGNNPRDKVVNRDNFLR